MSGVLPDLPPATALPPGCEPQELARLAEDVAREAGRLVHGGRPDQVEVASTKSSPTDVVTEMDRAAERLVRERLAAARPGDGVLGEEAGVESGTSALTWVVDPIDGTVNYLYGLPEFAVSVAVVLGDPTTPGAWAPVAGSVHAPALDRTWTAATGLGARFDGRPLPARREPPELAGALLGTGFGYRVDRRTGQARVLAQVLPLVRDVRRIGSAAIDLCMVADGRLDAYYERGLNPWDIAAAALVAQEAGIRVVGLRGAPPGPDMLVAAPDPLCADLAHRLDELGAVDLP